MTIPKRINGKLNFLLNRTASQVKNSVILISYVIFDIKEKG
jgi:hypothetical protein